MIVNYFHMNQREDTVMQWGGQKRVHFNSWMKNVMGDQSTVNNVPMHAQSCDVDPPPVHLEKHSSLVYWPFSLTELLSPSTNTTSSLTSIVSSSVLYMLRLCSC